VGYFHAFVPLRKQKIIANHFSIYTHFYASVQLVWHSLSRHHSGLPDIGMLLGKRWASEYIYPIVFCDRNRCSACRAATLVISTEHLTT
jgi:hypothetical protein